MAAQGRKNVHGKTGVRFKAAYTKSKYENMLRNVVTDLVIFGKVKVTEATARDVVSKAEHLITVAKKEDKLNAKREAAAFLRNNKNANGETALKILFDTLAVKYKDRKGGYTRRLKLGNRQGDNAPIVIVAFVD